MKYLFTIFLLFSFTTFAQITITSSDIGNYFAVGNTTNIHTDTITTSIDIGTPGAGNNWDFTGLKMSPQIQISNESIDPASSPFISDYSGADICIHSVGSINGITSDIYSYLTLTTSASSSMGNASTTNAFQGLVTKITFDPDMTSASLPQTFNTFWSQGYTQTIVTELNGVPLNTITQDVFRDVLTDAYGTMTLPGGITLDALRMEDVTQVMTTGGTVTSHSFTFITKSGAQVNVPVEETSGNSGVVNVVSDISWNTEIATDVENTDKLPQNYSLNQNYPNPFNPATTIEFSLPKESFVQLKIYDLLGNEVATLVNDVRTAGTYRANFNAENISSGLYIARITAGSFSQTIKMTLLR